MEHADLKTLRCPACQGELLGGTDGRTLDCTGCRAHWPVRGLPRLFREEEVRGTDRLLRTVYDLGSRWHDPAVRYVLPLVDSCPERELRDGYIRRMELGTLRPRKGRRPLRILEVGVGAGANIPLVHRELPPGARVEYWGLDLSEGMLARCRERVAREGWDDVRLLMADAHALPFAAGTFDRVFHVGGIGGFRDPGLALAEMARVAVPGTPIVVMDEQLDPAGRHGLVHRAAFRLLTWYDRNPHCPTGELPPGATDVREEAISRFYYCLSFRVPAPEARDGAST